MSSWTTSSRAATGRVASAVGQQLFPGPKAGPTPRRSRSSASSGACEAGWADRRRGDRAPSSSRTAHRFDTRYVRRHAHGGAAGHRWRRRCGRCCAPSIPGLAVSDVRSMDARIADSLVARRSPAVLAALFGALALLLTAIGTYGVVSYAVAQRRREIALRMALGAPPRQIGRAFAALGLRLVAVGSIAGLAGAWAAGRACGACCSSFRRFTCRRSWRRQVSCPSVSLAACLVPPRARRASHRMEALDRIVKSCCCSLAFLFAVPVAVSPKPDPPHKCADCDDWNKPHEPFRVFGNTYYVGADGRLGGAGHQRPGSILLDGGLPQTAPLIDANIRKLGFKTEDISLIVNSHAHYDHAGGIAALQRASGATVAASAAGRRRSNRVNRRGRSAVRVRPRGERVPRGQGRARRRGRRDPARRRPRRSRRT